MRWGPDRLNRGLLTAVGLLLLGVGAYGLARGWSAFGADQADEPLLVESLRLRVGRNANWLWPVTAAVCVVVAVLSLLWLLAQLRSSAVSDFDLTEEGSQGTTRLRASGAAEALADDIEGYLGVRSASARVVADGARPEVDVHIDVHDDADVPAVRGRVEDDALPRFCQALEVETVRATLLLKLTSPGQRVVR